MKVMLRLIRATTNFYLINDNPNVILGIADCSLYTRSTASTNQYYKKRMDMIAYTPVENSYYKTLAKRFMNPTRQNQFIRKNIFNNAVVRRFSNPINKSSAFALSDTENPFWYQHFDLRQNRMLTRINQL